jgi:hypothetical protein
MVTRVEGGERERGAAEAHEFAPVDSPREADEAPQARARRSAQSGLLGCAPFRRGGWKRLGRRMPRGVVHEVGGATAKRSRRRGSKTQLNWFAVCGSSKPLRGRHHGN